MTTTDENQPESVSEVQFISELELGPAPELETLRELLKERLTKQKLEAAANTTFQHQDVIRIIESCIEFTLSFSLFTKLSNHTAFNKQMVAISQAANTLLCLLKQTPDNAMGYLTLEFLFPTQKDRDRLLDLTPMLDDLASRAEHIQQECPRGRPKHHGPELDRLLSELRQIWADSGGNGIGAHWSDIEEGAAGGFFGLVRLSINEVYEFLNHGRDDGLKPFALSDSHLVGLIKQHFGRQNSRGENPG